MHIPLFGVRPALRERAAIAFVVGLAAPAAGAEPLRMRLANGIDATIHTAEALLRDRTTVEGDRLFFEAAPGLRYELVIDTSDPVITNKGDGQFHPMPVDAVVAALEAVRLPDAGLPVEVFVLPYPRREVLDSSARDGMILLSPGVRPLSEYAVHFTVTHEIGHVYQYRWLPDHDGSGWGRYNGLRSIEDEAIYHARAAHENRPHEVFAEDFRFLFGGDTANYSGSIENAALALPDEVAGLEDFLRSLSDVRRADGHIARLATSPNPFNPDTEIQVHFTAPQVPPQARVRVLDAHGREVRRLFDGAPVARLLRIAWDGRDELGARVASGLYFAHLDCAGSSFSTKLVLLK